MRILLTGASGFIGHHLQRALLAAGHELTCLSRHPPPDAQTRLRWMQADFTQDTEQSVWMARVAGMDAVINAVGIFREQGTQTFARLHTQAPCALFAACAAAGVPCVIHISALGADAHASTAYHLSKKAADDCLAALPLHSYIVQPSLVYGADGASARLFRMLASLPLVLRFGHARQRVQPIHVDDLVAAILALLAQPRDAVARTRVVALVGPQPLEFTDYLATLRMAMGLGRLRVWTVPAWLVRLLPRSVGGPDALSMLERGNTADPAATTALLGHAPRPPSQFIGRPGAARLRARLDWLLPLLRWSIALVWIVTAIVSLGLYPVEDSYALLARTGVPAPLQPLMLYGAALLDLAIGAGILLLRRRRWLWLAQMALIGFYTVVIAVRLPAFLLHPYGPILKNLPLLAAIGLLYACEEE